MPKASEQMRAEAFIPHFRRDLIEMCLSNGGLPEDKGQQFRDLCDLMAAYRHFQTHAVIEEIKRHYAPFDPDRDIELKEGAERRTAEGAKSVVDHFVEIARCANFYEVTEEEIRASFESETLIKLRTKVELADFQDVRCFALGDTYKTAPVKKLLKMEEQRIDVYQRVLLLLHYQEDAYFEARKKRKRANAAMMGSFKPGHIYTYLYKDVPKFDLELLFPNVEVGMTLKDKLLFGVPAVGGAIGVLIKILPQLLLILGVVLFLIGGREIASDHLNVDEESVRNIMPVLTALMGVIIALGGLAFKQWSNYRKKRIEFLKDVSEQLFFRNLASNMSVFHRVIDRGEEEDNKEMVLVLYHLLTHAGEGLTSGELDAAIEAWMKEKFGSIIDFDIEGPLTKLGQIRGPLRDGSESTLVHADGEGRYRAVSIADALHMIDHLWDGAFRYA